MKTSKLLVYIVGKPGAGKGTVAQSLVDQYNTHHIIASKLLFQFLYDTYGKNSEKVKQVLEAKTIEYYPALDTMIMESIINSNNDIILIDGYPRIENQLKAHTILLSSEPITRNYKKIILWLNISDKQALHRIQNRRICQHCSLVYSAILHQNTCKQCGQNLVSRIDDSVNVFKNRIASYKNTVETINLKKSLIKQ